MADFEKASRLKLRFDTALGMLSAEDLWDLPLTSRVNRVTLDDIARGLHKELQNANISFVEPASPVDEKAQLRFDIVKHVIAEKVAERKRADEERARAAKKQRIMEIMAQKRDETLQGKTLAELEQELASL